MLLSRPQLEVGVMQEDELKAGAKEPYQRETISKVFPSSQL